MGRNFSIGPKDDYVVNRVDAVIYGMRSLQLAASY